MTPPTATVSGTAGGGAASRSTSTRAGPPLDDPAAGLRLLHAVPMPVRGGHPEPPAGSGEGDVEGPPLLPLLLVPQVQPERLEHAVERGQDGRVAAELEVQRLPLLG